MTFMSRPYTPGNYLEHRPMTPRLRAAFRARAEYRANRAALEALGVNEWGYILTRLKDQGFASAVMPEVPSSNDGRPAHVRVPGLVVANPTGDQVNA